MGVHTATITHGLDLSSFPTQVRSAADVLWRATPLSARDSSQTVAECHRLEVPTAAETEAAANTVEAACRNLLDSRVGQTLELPLARTLHYMRGWVSLQVRVADPSPVAVCFGQAYIRVLDRERLRRDWANVEGRDGCLVVFRGHGDNCQRCSELRRTRRKTIEAEANANYRGFMLYPVWYEDGSTGTVRIGRCGCGAEFQTEPKGAGLRQTRCENCRKSHRIRPTPLGP